MNDRQLPLDLTPTTRSTDPGTSWAAARDAALTAPNSRARVLRAFRVVYPAGLTDAELAPRVHLPLNSANKRRGELRDAGFGEDSGDRRPTPTGSKAIVWRYVP